MIGEVVSYIVFGCVVLYIFGGAAYQVYKDEKRRRR